MSNPFVCPPAAYVMLLKCQEPVHGNINLQCYQPDLEHRWLIWYCRWAVCWTDDKLGLPAKARIFVLLQTGGYPDSCPVGVGTPPPLQRVEQLECEADHSPPPNANVKKSLPST
jgi:hypothetical protein